MAISCHIISGIDSVLSPFPGYDLSFLQYIMPGIDPGKIYVSETVLSCCTLGSGPYLRSYLWLYAMRTQIWVKTLKTLKFQRKTEAEIFDLSDFFMP